MAGLYTGLTIGFNAVLCRPCVNTRPLLAAKAPFRSLFTLRSRSETVSHYAAHPPPTLALWEGFMRRRTGVDVKTHARTLIPRVQRASFSNAPPSKPELVFRKGTFKGNVRERERAEWLAARRQKAERIPRTVKEARKLEEQRKKKKVFGRRKLWTWRWRREKLRRMTGKRKWRFIPWKRARRIRTWIGMRSAYHRKFWPIIRRRPRLPFTISTLDPERLQQSDYITLSWDNSCWITTDMLLPRRIVYERLDENGKLLEDWDDEYDQYDEPMHEDERIGATSSPFHDDVHQEEPASNDEVSGEEPTPDGEVPVEKPNEDASNPALYGYRPWAIPRFAQEAGYPADATDPESLRKLPLPPPCKRPTLQPRKWALPRAVRGRHETRKYRLQTRRQNKWFRKHILGIERRPLFWYYRFTFPPSLYEPRGGFLYLYKPPPGMPETAVGLRFRITNDSNPGSFVFGKDLTYQGVPWTVPLHYGPIRNKVIRTLLFKDNLLPLDIIRRCGALRRRAKKWYTLSARRYQRMHKALLQMNDPSPLHAYRLHRDMNPYTPLIYALGQPFVLDFSSLSTRIFVLSTKDGKDIYYPLKLRLPKWRAGLGKTPGKLKASQTQQAPGREGSVEPPNNTLGRGNPPRRAGSWGTENSTARPTPGSKQYGNSEASQKDENSPKGEKDIKSRRNVVYHPLYTGSAVVRFETVMLPEPVGVRVVVLRVVRVIDPIKVTASRIQNRKNVPQITEGSLLPWINHNTMEGGPWYWPRTNRPPDALPGVLMSLPEFSQNTSL